MLQDYDTSFSRVYFSRPQLFRHPLSSLPFRPFSSSVVARSFSLYRLSFDLLPGAGSCSLHAPPKSKICPLVADFTISDTKNRKFTNRDTENPQTEHTIIATVKSLDDCSSESSLIQTHEII
ncbi:hypothetical protein TNCV_4641 [Trichonephila clavipes]|nr:hypothetical protein TNCV_4641 [Trichonephila clavipes]